MKKNSTWVVTVLYVFGVLALVVAGFSILTIFQTPGNPYSIAIPIIAFSVAIPFFFFSQVLQNLIDQTELLKEIKMNTSRFIKKEEEESKVE